MIRYHGGPLNRWSGMKLSIVVPVFNEEKRLSRCLDSLLKFSQGLDDVEIIVAEDGSTDGTLRIAEEYASQSPKVRVTHSPHRLGKGGGIWNGIRMARGELVMFMDVDLSTSPDQIPKLIDAIEHGADLAIGSRALPESKLTKRRPLTRKILSTGFNWLFRLLFEIEIKDTQCGFKMMRRKVAEDLAPKIRTKGFAFDVELIVEAHDRGYKIKEVPITWAPAEGSKINLKKHTLEMGIDVLRLWLSRLKRTLSHL